MTAREDRRAPTAREIDIAQAWVKEHHGDSPNGNHPGADADRWHWETEAHDAYEMVLAVLEFTSCQPRPFVIATTDGRHVYGPFANADEARKATRKLAETRNFADVHILWSWTGDPS